MANVSRREAITTAAIGGAVLMPTATLAARPADQKVSRIKGIEHYAITPHGPGIPRASYAVARGDTVYTSGVTANLVGAPEGAPLGDVKDQTRRVLEHIDKLLAEAGTDKSRLLTVLVWLTDMNNFADHNDAWNEWLGQNNPPVRACVNSPKLLKDGMLVEIMITAARDRA